MFTLGTAGTSGAAVAGYTLGNTAATPLPGSPYALDLALIHTVGDATPLTMALADNYLYVLATEPGSVGDYFLSYSVSSSGLTLASYGGAPPGAFDRNTVAMIPNAGNIYFVSARDGTTSTIETAESYLDIAQASNGVLSVTNGLIPLDNCRAQAANLDVTTSNILVSCAPGTGTPTALIIPFATPTAQPTVVTVPTPATGTVGKSLLVDGYLYVIVNGMILPINNMAPTDVFQSYSVAPSGAVTFIQQYTVGAGPCCSMVSIAAGGGYLFYSDSQPENGGVTSVQISAGNMTGGSVGGAVPSTPDGNLFFDAPASMLLSNYEFRSYGAFVMLLASPNNAYGVDTDSNSAGLAVVGN